jgi:hypothetical protein
MGKERQSKRKKQRRARHGPPKLRALPPLDGLAALAATNGAPRHDPRQLLRELIERDPLGLLERCKQRIQGRALLLDVDAITARAAAQIVFRAARLSTTDLEALVPTCIDAAIEDEVVDEAEEEARGLPWSSHRTLLQQELMRRLGVESGLARRFSVVFNALPTSVRRAFFGAVVERKSIDQLVLEGQGPPAEIERRVQLALESVAHLRPLPAPPEDGDARDE